MLHEPAEQEFASRGALNAEPSARIEIFRVAAPADRARDDGAPVLALARDSVKRTDELAFSYEHKTASPFLLVFGVDEHGHVFWYHPAWTNASQDPSAVPIERDGRRHELKEAISHALDGNLLEIHAVFSERPLTVRAVEAILAGRRAPLGALAIPGATDTPSSFVVTP